MNSRSSAMIARDNSHNMSVGHLIELRPDRHRRGARARK